MPQIISSKSWLLKSWHICRTHLIWKKKLIIFISNQQSCFFRDKLYGCIRLGNPDLDFEIRISDFAIKRKIQKRISLLVLIINFISQTLKISPTLPPPPPNHPNSKAWLLRIQINNLLHCTFNKTLKKANFANKPFIRCWKRTDLPLKIKALNTPWRGIGDWTIKRVVLKRDKQYGQMSFEGENLTKYRVKHYHKHF